MAFRQACTPGRGNLGWTASDILYIFQFLNDSEFYSLLTIFIIIPPPPKKKSIFLSKFNF